MYKLENLPYLFQDLEPFLDTHTLGVTLQQTCSKLFE